MTREIKQEDEWYRATFEYEITPSAWAQDDRGRSVRVQTGPPYTVQYMIGPYNSVAPLKSHLSRNRSRYGYTNLKLVSVEKVTGWEEVYI